MDGSESILCFGLRGSTVALRRGTVLPDSFMCYQGTFFWLAIVFLFNLIALRAEKTASIPRTDSYEAGENFSKLGNVYVLLKKMYHY